MLEFWDRLKARGKIYKGNHVGFYSSSEEAFVPKNEVLFDYGKKKHVHIKSGTIVEVQEEVNYLFKLREWNEELKRVWGGPHPIAITERFRPQVLAELKDIPEVSLAQS